MWTISIKRMPLLLLLSPVAESVLPELHHLVSLHQKEIDELVLVRYLWGWEV